MASNVVTRIYQNFRGVDFRGEEINLVRSPEALNVWKDYKKTDSIRTRPGLKLVHKTDEKVYGVFFYEAKDEKMCLVHAGSSLYKGIADENGVYGGWKLLYPIADSNLSEEDLKEKELRRAKSDAFIFNNLWYFKDGKHYLQYDGTDIKEVEGYVPTTSIGRKPAGGGTKYEDVNMLTDRRINTFLADGESTEYFLDVQNIQDIDKFVPIVKVNGEEVVVEENFSVDPAAGKITFKEPPAKPLTDGQDNVSIEFKKDVSGYRDKINKCTLLQVFDNRVFFSGNPDFPNMLWHCSLTDPTYCSDLDYYNEGFDSAKIKGLAAGNNALWVFKEPSQANTTVFYHTPANDEEYGKIYPSAHSSIATGCVGKAINFNDDIVFFSERGMEGISGDITTEQVIAHRSSMVDRKLTSERNYADMVLEEWEGYLVVFIDDKVYLADSRAMFENGGHIEYEWFYWKLNEEVTCAKVNDGVLYIGTETGVYSLANVEDDEGSLSDIEEKFESYWITPKDKFKYPQYLKSTNKRGCVVEATDDVSVYVKTEKDKDFELVGTYNDIKDYFVSRIKCKKFKDIQLKFYSNTKFSIETATLECFVGGYIKR